jgi:hypothetical protein
VHHKRQLGPGEYIKNHYSVNSTARIAGPPAKTRHNSKDTQYTLPNQPIGNKIFNGSMPTSPARALTSTHCNNQTDLPYWLNMNVLENRQTFYFNKNSWDKASSEFGKTHKSQNRVFSQIMSSKLFTQNPSLTQNFGTFSGQKTSNHFKTNVTESGP